MNKQRNIVLILTLVVCIAVFAAVFVGCNDTFTVTFAGENVTTASQTVNKGGCATEPKSPERDGYTFKYWYLTDESQAYDFATAVTSDITLHAYWQKNETPQPTQYTVTFAGEGVSIASQTVNSGSCAVEPKDPVREGFTFKYWYLTDENEAYDFATEVTSNITLNALWEVTEAYIYWNAGQYAEILLFGQSGDLQVSRAEYGVEVMFKLHVYSDAAGTAVVTVNNKPLTADDEGWYTFVVDADEIQVAVEGLERDTTPITGVGTARDPYVLSTPANFKRFIDAVNNPNNTRYNSAYVVLSADLSFNGEELEPIGLKLNSTHFEGTFDGQGHTLSDFTMKGTDGFGGLFGYVVTGVVKNLNIKNAVYDIDASYESNYIVGGIVAYNMGSDIFGCSFEGDINVPLQISGVSAFVGGIIGFGQGYSDTNSATISYCESRANITSNGIAPILAVGGIAGSVYGTADSAPLVIYNSTFNGNISGKIVLAGGIVGYMRQDTAIANCFASGSYVAANTAGYSAAGAFVGLSEQNTAITNSYSTATYSATHSSLVGDAMDGTLKGELVGNYYPDGDKTDDGSVDGKEILIVNSYLLRDGQVFAKGKYDQTPAISFADFAAVKALLKWNDSEWSYANNALQVVVEQDQDYKLDFTVTFDFGGKTVTVDGETLQGVEDLPANTYIPLDWIFHGNGQNTFKAEDSSISYGFYLDAARTIRLPAAMLITSDITVYVGFADYSAVEAEYYVTDAYGDQAKLVFDDNGMLTMTYNGMIARYVYVYDGDKILIKDAYFAYLFYKITGSTTSLIADFYATMDDGELAIYDNLFYTENSGLLYAYKSNAVMGDWYDAEQSVYTFYLNGTGIKVATNTLETLFDYTLDGNNVTIKISGVTYNATLSSDGRRIVAESGLTLSLDKYDVFAGEWETDFNNPVAVTFDGMGTMTFGAEEFGYTVDSDGVITFAKGSAIINKDGLIEITFDGGKYTLSRAHSYRGSWYDSSYDYTVVFEGIGVEGYGTGYDSQGVSFTYVATSNDNAYASGDGYSITLYLRTTMYGFGDYTKDSDGQEFISFAVYYQQAGAIFDNFVLAYYDPLQGDWSDDNGVDYSFNGLGAYDVNTHGDNMDWILEGEVTISDGQSEQTVRYYYNRTTRQATFTYNNASYVVSVDNLGNATFKIGDGASQDLYAPDVYADIILAGDGYMVIFNGKSTSDNGIAIVLNGLDEQIYSYVLDGLNATLFDDDGEVAYTITLDQSLFMVLSDGTTEVVLGMYSPMSGNIYVASNGYAVMVGAFNMVGEAEGIFLGDQAYFLLQSQDQIAVYINGQLMYYMVQSKDEFNVGLYDSYGDFVAMLVIPDDIWGTFTAQDGSTFDFDGRSLVIGYYATVTYMQDDVEQYYYYSFNDEDGSFTIFALDRSGEYDETIDLYTVYLTETDGATQYVDEYGNSVWIVVVEAE